MKLIDCDVCGVDNMYVQKLRLTCRQCGNHQDIPTYMPTLGWIKEVIFTKAGKDLAHIEHLKGLFLFDESLSLARRKSIYYNILVYMTHGKEKTT